MAWNQESFRTSAILWQVKLFEAIIVVVVVVVVIVIIIIIISSSTSRSQQLSPWRGPESSPWLHLGMASGQMIGEAHEKGGKKGVDPSNVRLLDKHAHEHRKILVPKNRSCGKANTNPKKIP